MNTMNDKRSDAQRLNTAPIKYQTIVIVCQQKL